jgi:hypothetical protein
LAEHDRRGAFAPQGSSREQGGDLMLDVVKYDDEKFINDLPAYVLDAIFESAIYREWKEWSQASIEWSRSRRSQWQAERRLDRAFLAPAVLGLILLCYFVTRAYPIEQWYVGIASVLLIVPYLTRRVS